GKRPAHRARRGRDGVSRIWGWTSESGACPAGTAGPTLRLACFPFSLRWIRSLPMEPGTSWIRPIVRALIAVLPCLVLAGEAAAQPDRGPDRDIPPWKRPLSGEAAAQVEKLEQQIDQLRRAGPFAEAIEPAREVGEHPPPPPGRRPLADRRCPPRRGRLAQDCRLAGGRPQGAGVGGGTRPEGQCGAPARALCRIGAHQSHPAGDSPEMAG